MHSLIWLLDCAARHRPEIARAARLKAQFPQPVYVGDEVIFDMPAAPDDDPIRARLLVGGDEVVLASFDFKGSDRKPLPEVAAHRHPQAAPEAPVDISLQQMEHLSGCLSFASRSAEISASFSDAVRVFGLHRICCLVNASTLVGMVVPGLHSLLSGIDLTLTDDATEPEDAIRFSVTSITPRFRLVRIDISTRGWCGSIETLNRMPPVKQLSAAAARTLVGGSEFRDTSALVIGGSRGLGELTAKLIAAGGGRVTLTYASGKSDAELVAAEIREQHLDCTVLAYDVLQPAMAQLHALQASPTHLFYFATPAIFRRKHGLFDVTRFQEFNAFYVTGFFELVRTCLAMTSHELKIFYPSSSALDQRPGNMTEYSMSKAAAEVLCADLSRFVPRAITYTHRLPRLPTDQTSSVMTGKSLDPVQVILPILRAMHAKQAQPA